MFTALTDKLRVTFKKMRGYGTLTEANIQEALRDVRMALLEADVNFKVVKAFVDHVREKAMGQTVHVRLDPGQQFIGLVHDELVAIMGTTAEPLRLAPQPPTIVMMCGLQGSGKTTTTGKLARFLAGDKRRPLMVAADIKRPAAIDQLETIGKQLSIPVFSDRACKDAVDICRRAYELALAKDNDLVLLDTAGRLHIDDEMMTELEHVSARLKPHEVLLVVDAMTGQDAVRVAEDFNRRLELTGVILTKLDGDARGGAALSVRHVTGKPIKFVGVGEKLDALQLFHPQRMASRILDMGDVLSLVEKAQSEVDETQARKMTGRMFSGDFNLEDFLSQLEMLNKMGPIGKLLEMLPGFGEVSKMQDFKVDEKQMGRTKAIIQSMTFKERRKPDILNGNRRKRIADGSGTTVQDVNQLLKQFVQAKKMMKQFGDLTKKKGKGFRFPMPF
ncbi:MAG: signal recognition particle protein [Candidatus Riflebacteria bacterium]|nr:signal recognition particle protein [Candidatus Riflebacteria bacterium]